MFQNAKVNTYLNICIKICIKKARAVKRLLFFEPNAA